MVEGDRPHEDADAEYRAVQLVKALPRRAFAKYGRGQVVRFGQVICMLAYGGTEEGGFYFVEHVDYRGNGLNGILGQLTWNGKAFQCKNAHV